MAVRTDYHGKGIGQNLIYFAHEKLKNQDVNITMTYGDIKFYSKSGYDHISNTIIASPLPLSYPEGWLACSLDGKTPLKIDGPSYCIEDLNNVDLW